MLAKSVPIKILRRGLGVRIEPADPVHHLVSDVASFDRVISVSAGRGRTRREYKHETLYKVVKDRATGAPYILTYAGILPRLAKALRADGFVLEATDLGTGMPDFEPQYDHLDEITLRDAQMRMLKVMLSSDRAQMEAPTGAGKTFLVRVMCQCYPQPDCRIVVAVPNRNLLHAYLDTLIPLFKRGEVGQVGDGRKDLKARIIVSTFDSLALVDPNDKYILFVDEVHETGTELRWAMLSRFVRSKMFGLSGSTECRADKADLAVESLFGPVVERSTYLEGVEQGYLADVETYFYLHSNQPCDLQNDVARRRKTVWANAARNQTIATVCKYWDAKLKERNGTEPQIVILVDTVEHMFHLKQLLPDYTLVYNTMSDSVFSRLMKQGLIPRGWRALKASERQQIRRDAEAGLVRKLMFIGTSGGTGIDFRNLDVLMRADAGQTERTNIQYRGRATRGEFGIYADIADTGPNETLRRKARKRFASAKKAGWKPKVIDLWNNHQEVLPSRGR